MSVGWFQVAFLISPIHFSPSLSLAIAAGGFCLSFHEKKERVTAGEKERKKGKVRDRERFLINVWGILSWDFFHSEVFEALHDAIFLCSPASIACVRVYEISDIFSL